MPCKHHSNSQLDSVYTQKLTPFPFNTASVKIFLILEEKMTMKSIMCELLKLLKLPVSLNFH